MAETARRLSWDDYQAFPEDGKRRQILDGEVVMSPSPNVRHQDVVGELFVKLRPFCRKHRLGKVYVAPLGVLLPCGDVVEPDLLFVSNEGAEKLEKNRVFGAPDLVVEVLSPSNRRNDLIRKRRIYEAAGVLEYWIVDPEAESVTRFARVEGAFGAAGVVFADPGGTVESPLLPGLELDVKELFGELEPAS